MTTLLTTNLAVGETTDLGTCKQGLALCMDTVAKSKDALNVCQANNEQLKKDREELARECASIASGSSLFTLPNTALVIGVGILGFLIGRGLR